MGNRSGFSLVELVVAAAIVTMMTGLATLGVVRYLSSQRTYSTAYKIADTLSMAREQAIARYEVWRLCLGHTDAASRQAYALEYCDPSTSACDPANHAQWLMAQPPASLAEWVRIQPVLGDIQKIRFDRNGRFLGDDTSLRICNAEKQPDGSEACGAGAYIMQISPVTGRVTITKE